MQKKKGAQEVKRNDMKKISVSIPIELHTDMKIWAARRRMHMKDYTHMALQERVNIDNSYE